MMLTRRLEAIVREIPQCGLLADVGCDHGYIGVEAVLRGIAERVALLDVSAPSLTKAVRFAVGRGVRAAALVSDGFAALAEQPDAAVICGMGGREIVRILTRAQYKVQELVLQPMRDLPLLRASLKELGYGMVRDYIVESEGKFYWVLRVSTKEPARQLTPREELFGATNLRYRHEDFLHYLAEQLAECRALLAGSRLPEERRAELAETAAAAEEYLNETGDGGRGAE